MAVRPSSGATSAGDWPSISVCHSTACQRSGSLANAFAARDRSRPASAVSLNGSLIFSVLTPLTVVTSSVSSTLRSLRVLS